MSEQSAEAPAEKPEEKQEEKPAAPAAETAKAEAPAKAKRITVNLQPGPEAPKLKVSQYKLGREQTVSFVKGWLLQAMKKKKDDAVFLFLQPGESIGFAPSPEQTIGDLSDAFAPNTKLSITYAFKETWG
eukprot:TRINITY_DN11926_c3_g1_i1.p1 TRINITY_DN11926_c3_g1~~TRINITY_DN11926_c3_g1_i1.p1  ORF type:complete len:130 (+),score=38.05 TRINITY_DN11926_c3_g1_i1:44-433(+)